MSVPYIAYYEHLAKLACIANKKTMFLAHLLHRLEYDPDLNMCAVSLTAYDKRKILKDIGAISSSPLVLASQYLTQLQKAGLIKSIGGGRFIIDPMSYGYAKYIPKQVRDRSSKIFENRVFTDDSIGKVETFVELDNGEIMKIEDAQ